MSMTSAFSWLKPTVRQSNSSESVPADPTIASTRLPGPDATRAVALIGVVVMNYHGYLNGGEARAGDRATFAQRLFDPWEGVLSTRFAATFVLVAGVGVTLLTNRSRTTGSRDAIRDDRWRLARRGLVLYAGGFLLDWIWAGTILFYYGAMFVIAALLFTLRTRWLVLLGVLSAIVAAALAWFRTDRIEDGAPADWLFAPSTTRTHSPRGLLFDTFVNGTHPLFPWLAFLCAGIVLGRALPALPRGRLLVAGVLMTAVGYALSASLSDDSDAVREVVFSTRPFDRGLLYTVVTLGSSLVAFCAISWLAERFRGAFVVRALVAAGRTTLSLYLLHVFVFRLFVDVAGVIDPTGLDTALTFAAIFWVVAILLAWGWTELFGMGPAERVYRRLGG